MNKFSALAHIMELNQFKNSIIDTPLDELSFRKGLKKCGIPSNTLFWTELKKSGLIVKSEGKTYVWSNTNPIHHSTLQSIYKVYQKKINEYYETRRNKLKSEKESEEQKVINAINLLKNKGFVIFLFTSGFYKQV